jgi:hypothetical protein
MQRKVFSLGLASASSNLRNQKVNTKRRALVVQEALQLCNLFTQHFRCVADTTNNTQATSISDSGGQLGASGHVHTCQQDGVVDLEQISESSTDLLYTRHSTLVQILSKP